MKYAPLPGTDSRASLIVLGTAWFGTAIAERDAFRLMDVYVEHGGNFLDTAHMYASWVKDGAGKSETTIGKWLKRVDRKSVLIATKGADLGMTRDGILTQFSQSLERLGLDRVDFYWLHMDDPKVPAAEIIEWLNELVSEGRASSFGCSNWKVARIQQANDYARQRGLRGFAASQIRWSLADPNPAVAGAGHTVSMDADTLAFHARTGLPQVAYSSQAGGFFAGNYDPKGAPPGAKPNPNIVSYYGTDENYRRLAAVKKLAAAKGRTGNQIALAYLMNHPFPCFPIVGANSPERVADSCSATEITLTKEEVRALERGEG
jgi:aryl-alcohol dehydrogenase-like predicted oxidoreductase